MEDANDQGAPAEDADKPSPTPQLSPENKTPDPNPPANGGKREETPADKFDNAVLRWTRVVGVFTAVLAFVGIVQVWAFIQSERASVVLDDEESNTVNPPLKVILIFRNGGKAEATARLHLSVNRGDINEPPGDTEMITEPFNIPSGGVARSSFVFSNFKNFSEIKSGKTSFNIYGFVEYTDDFSIFGSRRSPFCVTYNPNGNQTAPVFYPCNNYYGD